MYGDSEPLPVKLLALPELIVKEVTQNYHKQIQILKVLQESINIQGGK